MKKEFIKCMMGICVIGMMSLGMYGCRAGSSSKEPVATEAEAPGESEKSDVPEESEMPDVPEESEKEISLIGEIKEIESGQFRIAEALTGDEGDILAVPAAGVEVEEDDLKTIIYNEDTVFTFQTIWDGGAGHEEREGTADDLKEGLLVDMKGYYEDDVFHATEILISKVLL